METVNERALERREPAPAWQTWVETAALPAAFVVVGVLLDRRDPLLLKRAFSWLALAPLLAGLRYGSVAGMACGAMQVIALAIAGRWGFPSSPSAGPEVVLGWLVVALVAGEFRDAWLRRLRQLEASGGHLRLRLDGLGRAYRALEASHARLERSTPGRPPSLREALEAFRRELVERIDAEPLEAVGGRILALFSAHAFVRAATLHAVDRDGRPGHAIASLGAGRCQAGDPLVGLAARKGEVVSRRDVDAECATLAAVPLVDVEGRVHAVVAVRDMPFVSLHRETLELLALLGGHVGDAVSQAQVPALPRDRFFRSVSLALADARRHGVPSSLVFVRVRAAAGPSSAARRMAVRLAAQRRLTDDAAVLLDSGGSAAVAVLLRFAGAEGLGRYRARLEQFVREELGAGAAISIRAWLLADAFAHGRPGQVQAFLTALAAEGASRTNEMGTRRRHEMVAAHDGAGGV